MPTYAIGDVQGCYDELQALLKKINFMPEQDELWFVGDLVNRGPKSLEVLEFIMDLPKVKIVLGNHDFHLLALAYDVHSSKDHTLDAVLNSPSLPKYITWLRQLPLLYHDPKLNYVMTHAGIYPHWDLTQAKQYAAELTAALQSERIVELLKNLYGDQPDHWQENLTGWDRLRFIVNAFTRMRFCNTQGRLNLKAVGKPGSQPAGFFPWYDVPNRKTVDAKIIVGHWAALEGITHCPNVFAIDTGCAWGNCLTAMRLEDLQRFNVNCK